MDGPVVLHPANDGIWPGALAMRQLTVTNRRFGSFTSFSMLSDPVGSYPNNDHTAARHNGRKGHRRCRSSRSITHEHF
jgi:hypothetical protein